MHGYLFFSRHRNMEHALFEGSVLAKSVLNLIRIEAVFNLGFFYRWKRPTVFWICLRLA